MCNNKCITLEVVIVEEDFQTLLGRQDAKNLEVLKVGLDVCKDSRIPSTPNFKKTLGMLKDFELEIPINKNATLVIQPLRRIPYIICDKVENQLKWLLDNDTMEKVDGPSRWVSPIVQVAESEDDILCVDMRIPNEAVENEKFPMPTMEDLAPQLKGAKVYSKVDLMKAYYQILLAEKSRKITTFITLS